MKKINAKSIALSAAFAAVIFAVTAFAPVRIPRTEGYVNLGDSVIVFASYLLGGPLAACSAAVGSAMADITLSAAVYAPATFVIKGAMALIAGFVARRGTFRTYVTGALAAGVVMVAGYAAYELALFGAAYAVVGLPFNCVQAAASTAVSAALWRVAKTLRSARRV